MISDTEYLSIPIDYLYVFFGKVSIQVLCPFINQVICFLRLSCMDFLYSLETLIGYMMCKYFFSSSIGFFFSLMIVSFTVPEAFSLTQSPLVYVCFCFLPLLLETGAQKHG